MENSNGKGVFYGVIGIATLIVAIIGATFAYFTATAGSAPGAINVTSYSGFSISLSLETVVAADNLIPLDSAKYMNNALTNKVTNNDVTTLAPCTDINGDKVCAIYEMTLTNNGDTDADVVGYLSADYNDYTSDNLKYQIYNCTDGDDTDALADTFTAISGSNAFDAPKQGVTVATLDRFIVNSGQEDNTKITLPAKVGETTQSKTYCLVLWLEEAKDENGNPQPQNEDQGKTFSGRVTFNASTGSGEQLEAKFNLG